MVVVLPTPVGPTSMIARAVLGAVSGAGCANQRAERLELAAERAERLLDLELGVEGRGRRRCGGRALRRVRVEPAARAGALLVGVVVARCGALARRAEQASPDLARRDDDRLVAALGLHL